MILAQMRWDQEGESNVKAGLTTFAEWLAKIGIGIGAAATGLMMLHICADVAIRVVLRIPIYGTIEIVSKYMMVIIAFAPLAEIQRRREHLFVESFTALVPSAVNKVLDYLVIIYFLGLTGFYIYASAKKALEKTSVGAAIDTPAFDVPVWQSYWVIPIALTALAVVLLAQLVSGPREPGSHADHTV